MQKKLSEMLDAWHKRDNPTDPLGSYTGVPQDHPLEEPEQDADDL